MKVSTIALVAMICFSNNISAQIQQETDSVKVKKVPAKKKIKKRSAPVIIHLDPLCYNGYPLIKCPECGHG